MVDAPDPPVSDDVSVVPQELVGCDRALRFETILRVLRTQDLTGEVEKIDSFPFESGGVADISLGSTMRSTRIKGQMVSAETLN
jgi:hypothetical protein